MAALEATRPPVGFLEIHSENYLSDGGPHLLGLERLRRDYALSCHGVGLSLGSADGLDAVHLARLAGLIGRLEPALVSEHLAWSVTAGTYLNDLLPVPYTEEALAIFCANIDRTQSAFGRQILIENPSTYLRYRDGDMSEPVFIGEAVRRTGCRVLLDVNNVFVSAVNHGFDPEAYVAEIPADAVAEIHLAGHSAVDCDGETILIDDHGSKVAAPVWRLLGRTLARLGPRPLLIEWDTNVPELDSLVAEARLADQIVAQIEPARIPSPPRPAHVA